VRARLAAFLKEVGSFLTVAGAVATAVSAYLLYRQISDANVSLYSANSYTVQKDIAAAYESIREAQDKLLTPSRDKSHDDELRAAFKRQVIRFDTLFEAITAMHNNKGISDDTWRSITRRNCPPFSNAKYALGDVDTPSIKVACEKEASSWRGEVK